MEGGQQRQGAFDFNRAAQLRILERAVLPRAAANHKRRSGRGTLKAILKALDTYQREHAAAYPSVRTLSNNAGLSTTATRRGLHQLRALGYLTIDPRRRPDGSYTSHTYAINWSKLLDSVPPSEDGVGTVAATGGTVAATGGYCRCDSSHHKRPSKRPVKRNPYGAADGILKVGSDDGRGQEGKRFWGRDRPLTKGDLTDGPSVALLYQFALVRGWAGDGDRLRFFALCHYCGQVGREPGKLLTSMVKGRRWDVARNVDWDWAESRIDEEKQVAALAADTRSRELVASVRLPSAVDVPPEPPDRKAVRTPAEQITELRRLAAESRR